MAHSLDSLTHSRIAMLEQPTMMVLGWIHLMIGLALGASGICLLLGQVREP